MSDQNLLRPADVAKIFNQSLSWVSKNHKKLGGVKIGGRMFFPPREKLYDSLFCREEGLEVRLHDEGGEVHPSVLQDEKRSQERRTAYAIRTEQTGFNRHGLFDSGKQTA